MNLKQFNLFVLQPTLSDLGMDGIAATRLMLGTLAHESKGESLDQITGPNDTTLGPAYGFFQIEPATHDDLYKNFLIYRSDLMAKILDYRARNPTPYVQLATNLVYTTAIARLIYYRQPNALPDADDIQGLAKYWKDHYNTASGKGTEAAWLYDYYNKALPALKAINKEGNP